MEETMDLPGWGDHIGRAVRFVDFIGVPGVIGVTRSTRLSRQNSFHTVLGFHTNETIHMFWML